MIFDVELYFTRLKNWWYGDVKAWWYCDAKNPYHWKLVWYTLTHHFPFEDYYTYEVLQLCLKKSIYYFETAPHDIHQNHIDKTLMWLRISDGLLDIILEKREIWSYTNHRYKCLVKLNQKNMNRYQQTITDYITGKVTQSTRMYETTPHCLYKQKALVLLMRILQTYSKDWWD